jgi:hypothetical protein
MTATGFVLSPQRALADLGHFSKVQALQARLSRPGMSETMGRRTATWAGVYFDGERLKRRTIHHTPTIAANRIVGGSTAIFP